MFLNFIVANRPFPWLGLCDRACSTLLGECVLRLTHVWNAQRCLDYLQDSIFADLDHIVGCFDKTTKLRFRNSDEFQYIKFGGAKENDESYNIRFGQLKLLGSDVAKLFEPSVECIVKAVLDQCEVAHKPISVRRFCFIGYIASWTFILACGSHRWIRC